MSAGTEPNVDRTEQEKFDAVASGWWDPEGPFRPLHELNPARVRFIAERAEIAGMSVADVGCGGGILAESLARKGGRVTGIDVAPRVLATARLHLHESGLEVDYRQMTVEELAEEAPQGFDVVTCMEMLEHVPDPASTIAACARLVKPGGSVFFSTINRNPKSYLFAIIGAEYVLRLLPKGTHDFSKFIRPSELENWARQAELNMNDLTGMSYNPLTQVYSLGRDLTVNYLAFCSKEAE